MMFTTKFISAFLASISLVFASNEDTRREISVTRDSTTGKFLVEENVIKTSADAYGYYYTNYNASGWGYLNANMQQQIENVEQHLSLATSLGYLEGYVTCQTLKTFYPNFYSAVFGSSPPGDETIGFIEDNYKWMMDQAEANYKTSELWYGVKANLNQLNGIYQGLIEGCPSTASSSSVNYQSLENPTLTHILLLNAWGDLYQITAKYYEPGFAKGLPMNHRRGLRESSTFVERCSAIVKLLPNYEDVVYGHATWDSYESLGPRIFKHLSYPLFKDGAVASQYDVHFSSSPGLLSSVDDFFTVSGFAQLGVIETTNDLLNVSMLKLIQPKSLLSYMRATVANKVAKNGQDWAKLFSQYQSGTYTNQWMILDLNKFTPSKAPQRGFFTVVEEVPGTVHWEDMTDFLSRNTYWPSYNNPYFADIQQLSGYARACSRSSDWCYDTTPRANIFRERHVLIKDEKSGQELLAYNDFQNDPLSKNVACNAIACRGDLEATASSRGPYGALDAKVTTALTSKGAAPIIHARLGPTTDQQKPFCWSQLSPIEDAQYSHNGQPDCFDFEWTVMSPPN